MKSSAQRVEEKSPEKKNVHRFRTMVAHKKQHLLEPIMGVQLNQTGLGHRKQLVRDMFDRAVKLGSETRREGRFGESLEITLAAEDGVIYQQLREMVYPEEKGKELTKEEKVYNVGVMSNDQLVTRAGKRANDIARALPYDARPRSLLDIGCADGSITVAVMRKFGIRKEDGHGVDVENLKDGLASDFTFHQLDKKPTEGQNYLHYLQSDSIDLVVALMSLHHVEDQDNMIKEIHRVLRPGGFVLIREHDCPDDDYGNVLDIMHGLYSLVWSNPIQDINFLETYSSTYRSRNEWRDYFKGHHLKLTMNDNDRNRRFSNNSRDGGYDYTNNYCRFYYETFEKERSNRSGGPPPRKKPNTNSNG